MEAWANSPSPNLRTDSHKACRSCKERLGSVKSSSSHRSRGGEVAKLLTFVLVLLLCSTESRARRKFSLWLKKGGDLEQRLRLRHPLFLVSNGVVSEHIQESRYTWPQRLEPIDPSIGHYDFRWQALSKNVRYEIIVGTAHSYFLPKPTIQGIPMSGVVPRTKQSFSLHFPCHPEADERTYTLTVEFRFYRGLRRNISIFEPGQVMMTLSRKCPPRRRPYSSLVQEPECERICDLRSSSGDQNRSGTRLKRTACSANYIVRARLAQSLNPSDPESKMVLNVEKQYRTLKTGPKDNKVEQTLGVQMAVSHNVSDCECIKNLKEGEQYIFFAQQDDQQLTFADSSLVAIFNGKARKVLKRLRKARSECVNGVYFAPATFER